MIAHLPILQVILPLIAAPICACIFNGRLAWAFAVAVTWGAFAIAIALMVQVLGQGTVDYALGNWLPPIGKGRT